MEMNLLKKVCYKKGVAEKENSTHFVTVDNNSNLFLVLWQSSSMLESKGGYWHYYAKSK